jgi:predicted secreted acid phosphatase
MGHSILQWSSKQRDSGTIVRGLWSRTARVAAVAAATLALLTACTATDVSSTHQSPARSTTVGEPTNVGDAKIAAMKYYEDGAYAAGLAKADAPAARWIETEAPKVSKPAVVFDIDETALSNWPVIVADDFGRVISGPCDALPSGPCGWKAWDLRAQAQPIVPTRKVFDEAKKVGAAVFFITGRDESQRAATEANLKSAGYDGYTQLIMTPVGSSFPSARNFKAPQRAKIEAQGYTIIANIGDQPSDLAGGHALRTFLLPDPFYRIR